MVLLQSSFQIVERLQARLFEFGNPALVDLLQRHRVELEYRRRDECLGRRVVAHLSRDHQLSGEVIDSTSGLPIGPEVPTHAAARPERVTIAGRFIRLEPLDAERHGAALWQETHGVGAATLWQYLFDEPFADEKSLRDFLARKAASTDPLFYAIVDQATGRAVGFETLMRIDPAHRCIEVGNILYGRSLQRTPGATEAQFLLMRYIFEELGYRRYEWKCNALNAPSRRAALRFGFSFEGIFRRHMIVRGRNRDTAWYSMIDEEWPAMKAALERWLAPENFDAAGVQRQGLVALRGAAGR